MTIKEQYNYAKSNVDFNGIWRAWMRADRFSKEEQESLLILIDWCEEHNLPYLVKHYKGFLTHGLQTTKTTNH